MSSKNTVFYRNNRAVLVDFSAEAISSDGAVVLLEKLEHKHKVLDYFSKLIPDYRDLSRTVHSMKKLFKQRVFMLMQGYEDTNDVFHLQNVRCSKIYWMAHWPRSPLCRDLRTALINKPFLRCAMPVSNVMWQLFPAEKK